MSSEQQYNDLIIIQQKILDLKTKQQNCFDYIRSLSSLGEALVYSFILFLFSLVVSFLVTAMISSMTVDSYKELSETGQFLFVFVPCSIATLFAIFSFISFIPFIKRWNKDKNGVKRTRNDIESIKKQIEQETEKLHHYFKQFDLSDYLADKEITFFSNMSKTEKILLDSHQVFIENSKDIKNYLRYNKTRKQKTIMINNE